MTKQASAFVYAAGETPQLWVDGVRNTLAVTPGNPSGVTAITDTLELGRGGRGTGGSIGYFKGRCSLLALSSRRQPNEVLETFTKAFRDPTQVYNSGSVNLRTDTIASPVAGPAFTASPAGTAVQVDVGNASYDPGGLALTCTAATVLTGNGNATRSGDVVTVTPNSNAAVGDWVVAEYTVRNSSLKTSTSRVNVQVGGVVQPPPGPGPTTPVPKLQPDAVALRPRQLAHGRVHADGLQVERRQRQPAERFRRGGRRCRARRRDRAGGRHLQREPGHRHAGRRCGDSGGRQQAYHGARPQPWEGDHQFPALS